MIETSDAQGTTYGLSITAHARLKSLEQEGHFGSMTDGYRFAVALALAHGANAPHIDGKRQTVLNVGTLDRDGTLQYAVKALARDAGDEPVKQTIERLAEWGVHFLADHADSGSIPFQDLFDEAERRLDPPQISETSDIDG